MAIKTVFLSSTAKDLAKYRDAVYKAIEGLEGYHCVRMEDFGARDWAADAFCRAKVAECDMFVGIVGHLYGSCPEGSEQSYTEREYEAAVQANKPRLVFLAPEDFPLPASLIEPDAQRAKQRAFREQVSSERIRDTFASPEDLAWRVVRAIRNWEQGQAIVEARPSARPEGVMPLPPQPYFAHPYPMPPNFTGRVHERQMLTAWLAGGQEPVLALVALGGMGKSALAWAWLLRDVLGLPLPGEIPSPSQGEGPGVRVTARPEGMLWWSFYEREARFAQFLDEALTYTSGGKINPADVPSEYDKLRRLVTLLQQRRLLLVLDGFERELRAYASLNAAYQGDAVAADARGDFRACTDPHAADFLRWVAAVPLPSRVLLTSRLFPHALDDCAGCRREELTSLHPDDAVTFFHAQGVRGTRAEIQAACAPYGYLPLALRLLSGLIGRDKRQPGDIHVASRHPVLPELKGKEQHHILQVAYDELDKQKRELLSRLAAFRSPMNYQALAIFNTYKSDQEFDAALDELLDRGLLLFDKERGHYDLHPIVRGYAYDRLADKAGVHTRLRDYFAAVPTPEEDKVQSLEDLAPVIELYHHTVRAGRYDEACDLYYDRLADPLYFRFGAYQTEIELLRALFPDGEDRPPRLKKESDQAWTLNTLAAAYTLSGQSRRAVQALEMVRELDKKLGPKTGDAAVTLGNLAYQQIILGELAAAEGNLRRRIALCREIGDERNETIGHQELGRLLAYQGAFDEAAKELDASYNYDTEHSDKQGQCVDWAYRALRALLMGDARAALAAARRARELADIFHSGYGKIERDIIRAEWLLGAALISSMFQVSGSKLRDTEAETQRGTGNVEPGTLRAAETHLTEALTRCRRINMVDLEPDILLAWARWHHAARHTDHARQDAQEALAIADRCEYRLKQAEIHNFLARLALEAGEREAAKGHAATAYERAWCDGPPHCYKPALDEAAGMLQELRVELPRL
jgi:tetratricopeptide (TPR) repeat protein